MGPRGDEKFEKRDLERTKSSKNGPLKVSDPSLRGDFPGVVHHNEPSYTCKTVESNCNWIKVMEKLFITLKTAKHISICVGPP